MSCHRRCRQIRRLSSLEMKQARITYAGAGRWGKVRGEFPGGNFPQREMSRFYSVLFPNDNHLTSYSFMILRVIRISLYSVCRPWGEHTLY